MKPPASLARLLPCAAALLLLSALSGLGATLTWTNTSSGAWSAAANWSPNQVPAAADTVLITNSGTYTVTLDTAVTVAGFTLGTSSGSSTQSFAVSGFTFTLNGPGSVTTNGQFNFDGGTVTGTGTNTVAGGFDWSAGALNGPGLLTIAPGGTLNLTTASDHDLHGGRLNNAGTVVWAGGTIRGDASSVLNNSGLWDAQGDNLMFAAFSVGMTFNNAGTFRKSAGAGATTLQNDVVFNHTGLVDAQVGQIAMNAGGTSTGGSYNANTNALIVFNGSRSFSVTNSFTGAGVNRLAGGTYVLNGTLVSENLDLVGTTFNGTNTFVGTVNWTAGVFSGPGRTTLAAGSTLNLVSGNVHDLPDWTLNNAGTVVWSGGQIRSGPTTVINNTGLWLAQSDDEVNTVYGGGGTFNNAGTFRKAAGAGVTTLQAGVAFNNTGAVDVQTGTVAIAGGGTSTGGFNAGTGTTLTFTGGHTFSTTNSFTGPGAFRLASGAFTLNGTIDSQTFELAGGTLAGTNTFTGTVTWGGTVFDGRTTPGMTTIAPGGTLNLAAGYFQELPGWTLNNAGTAVWTGIQIWGGPTTVINNSGLWLAQSDSAINANYGAGATFNNAGTFRKAAGAGVTSIQFGVAFNNTGTVDVQTGTVAIAGGGVSTGGFNAGTGTTLTFDGGHTFVNTNSFTGAGTNRLVSGTFTLHGTVSSQNFELVGGTLAGTNTFTGTVNWSGMFFDGRVTPGMTTLAPGGTLNITSANNHDLPGWRLNNAGTVVWTGGLIRGDATSVINNPGLWLAQSDDAINSDYGIGMPFNNAGTFRKSAGAGVTTLQIGVAFNNTGTVDVQTGTVAIAGGGTSTGGFTAGAGTTVTFDGGHVFATTNSLTGAGAFRLASGVFTLNGTISSQNFELAGGSFTGTNTFTGTLTWTAGIFATSARTTIAPGATLNISSANNHDLPDCTLNNAGTVAWTGGQIRGGGGGTGTVINNTGLWLAQSDDELNNAYGGLASVFNNPGTFRKAAGLGATIIQGGVLFHNPGTVDAQTGVILFNGGGSATDGTFNAVTNARVDFNSNFAFQQTNSFTGTGTNQLVGGSFTGTNTLAGTLHWAGGTFNGPGSSTIAPGATFNLISGNAHDLPNYAFTNAGTLVWAAGQIRGGGGLGSVLHNTGLFLAQADDELNTAYGGAGVVFANAGTFRRTVGLAALNVAPGVPFTNSGSVEIQSGTLSFGDFYVQTAGRTLLAGGNFSSFPQPLDLQGGTLGGSGVVNASVLNNGTVAPGASPGLLTIVGNYTQTAAGALNIEINNSAGPGPGHDQLQVFNGVALDGTLNVSLFNTNRPGSGANYQFLFNPPAFISGQFALTNLPTAQATWRLDYLSAQVGLTVLNVAPVLAPIANATTDELTPFALTLLVSDPDLPPQTLAFTLVSAPDGVDLDPVSGVLTWTPTEAQGPSTNTITVRVSDNASPSLSDTQTFTVIVREVNTAPALTVPADQAINELATLRVTNTATDSDLPANPLTFSLVAAPTGVALDPVSGVLTWTPTEAQGPSTNLIVVRVTDSNTNAVNAQQLSTTNSFTVIVNELNVAPVLTVPVQQTVAELTTLTVTVTATDEDLPANPLTFSLVAAPGGVVIHPLTGVITWTPTEAQGPSTNLIVVRVTDSSPTAVNAQQLSTTNSFTVIVTEVNLAPVLIVPADQVLNELTTLTVTNLASDADLPANTLTFGLVSAPVGVVLNATNGVLTWTPTEAQGPSTNVITLRVVDDGVPSLSTTQSFTVIVQEVNTAPALTVPADQVLNELATLTVTNTATDSDLPANPLTFSLVAAPTGVALDPVTGVLTWTPTEAQGPSTNLIVVRVTDSNTNAVNAQQLSTTNSFTVIVTEVNTAPVLALPADRTINPGQTVTFTNSATDADLPATPLTFSLVSGPAAATVDPITGVFTWRAPVAAADTTNPVQVRVTDDGTPPLSHTRTFTITVRPLAAVTLTPVGFTGGGFELSLAGFVGPDYILQATPALGQPWVDLVSTNPAALPFSLTAPLPGGSVNRFYRVRIGP